MIYPEERETHIGISYFDKEFHLYSNNTTVIRRLIAKGYFPSNWERLSESQRESMEYIELWFPMENLKDFANAGIFKAL